jgi:OOP family OmpA-OmpF porin
LVKERVLKKIALVAAAAAAAVLSLSTAAHAEGVIAGAALGQAHLDVDCTGTTSCKDNNTGGKLMAGYKWDNGFAVEASYIDFGKFSAGVTGATLDVKPYALGVSGAFYAPIANDWALSVRLGVARVHTGVDATVTGLGSGSDSTDSTQALAGIGVSYMINKAASLDLAFDSTRAEYSNSAANVDEKGTLRLISLGLTYRF